MTAIEVRSEPLTYAQHAPHSYFRDLWFSHRDNDVAAQQRLQRHSIEMAAIGKTRNKPIVTELADGTPVEYRVSPDTTDGTGGYLTLPLWLTQMFAVAPRPSRVLSGLIKASFGLPLGVASVNVPILAQGTTVEPAVDDAADPEQDVTDTAGTSTVATLSGHSDWPLQTLEQSPGAAALDWVIFTDMASAYDADLETQLINGAGIAAKQLLGVLNVSNVVTVTYTDGSPTGSAMYPYLGRSIARIGNNRSQRPEVMLMRSARWGWLGTQESTAGLPFGLPQFYLGDDNETPDPITGILGLPVFAADAIPQTLGTAQNQDAIITLRPSDLILFEGQPNTSVMREVLSGTLGVRFQMHNRAAAITNRYPSGIAPVIGTGMAVQSGFNN